MAAMLGDDDFDQFDKPGAERSRRRRATDDDWDSELEDDLLEEDYLSGKKISPDLSDEELNDDLLQSDEEDQGEPNYSLQEVAVSLNATTGDMSSFDLSKSINEESTAVEAEFEEAENEEVYEDPDLPETNPEELAVDSYEENYGELVDEQVEYAEEETTDEVLELEINEPLDEFQEEDYAQSYKRQETNEEQYMENVAEDTAEPEDPANESEEVHVESQELPPDSKEESDEDDEEEEGGGRIRFKTERKEGTIIRLSDSTRERRNIPETLELSAEAKATLMEFEEMERQRKQGRFVNRRGGRRGGSYAMPGGMGGQRNDFTDRRNLRNRATQGQPIRSMFMQQHIQPLLPMPRPRNPSSDGLPSPQQEKSRMRTNVATPQKQQPKNIHINPHFKGNVAPVQVPLLPVPSQPRPAMGPPRFPSMPEFQHVPNPVPGNFNPPPRLQEPWRNPPPPPQPERDPFFIGEPRFPNHHIFDQRNPPPGPPPPLLNSNHQVPNQNPPPFNPPGQGFNQPGPQPRFSQPQTNFNPPGPGPQTSFNPPTPQSGFNQPGFNQPGPQTGFNQQGPQSGFNPQGPQSGFNASGNQPGFNQPNFNHPSPQPGYNQSGPQPPFNLPGLNQQGFNQSNSAPQPGFNQPGSGPQSNFTQHGPGPQSGFNSPGFSRERPVRMNMPPPSQLGMPPFNQPSANMRHFGPPRQQFSPGPGQPFMPHTQSNMQGPMQPIQSMHHHHHLGGPPKPPLHMQQPPPFRANSQTPSHRMPGQQRHGLLKQRPSMAIQNMVKTHNLQTPHSRNSNLRELPIAPAHSIDMNKRKSASAPAAQVRPVGTTAPQARLEGFGNAQAVKPMYTTNPVKDQANVEEQFPDEDEETRKYRLKIEEQKRLREEILKQKELRRQQQAGARKKELLERLSQQQPSSSAQQSQPEPENPTAKVENNCSQILPHITAQVRPHVRNRPISKKPESLLCNLPQKIPLLQTVGTSASFQGQQKKMIKQAVQTRVAAENQFPKVQQVCPAVSPMPLGSLQTVKVVQVQGRPQEQRPTGAKRTVMQRSNSSGDGQIASKVRVIKLSGMGDCVSVQSSEGNPQMQLPQQRIQPQQRPQYQQRIQQKTGPVRKVTLGKGSVQQQQHQQYQQQYQVNPRPQHSLVESVVPHVVNSIQGQHPQTKVIMRGRGRGVGGQMGRGRPMPNKQNLRVVECKPQPCVVSVEGLSSSTTDHQLKNLLMSVGPIQSLQMFPHQRKAIATFENPHHASQFQQRFHRHMIDLSHINVSLVTE